MSRPQVGPALSATRASRAKQDPFAAAASAPAFPALLAGLERGRGLSWMGAPAAAAAFAAVWLQRRLPSRAVLFVTDTSKAQETFLSDLAAWRTLAGVSEPPLCFPAWETHPSDGRLPSMEVVGERIETLAALTSCQGGESRPAGPLIVASATALTQRTFHPRAFTARTRRLQKGQTVNPLDLIEWLEDQGYEPEVRVSHPGEISLRGGIIDVWPLQASNPIRLEFFGDELDSLREFDPASQVSMDPVEAAVLPPAGEFGLFRDPTAETALLLDHLPSGAVVFLWSAESAREQAQHFAAQAPAESAFLADWESVLKGLGAMGGGWVALSEFEVGRWEGLPGPAEPLAPAFETLEAWRPLAEAPVDPPVAEAARRELFGQMHRWLRQGNDVRVFCHTEGERQRFGELWAEQRFDEIGGAVVGELAPLSRGFLIPAARLAVVTDAEVFGRGKTRRARRLRGRHAQARESSLQVDFTEFEEGDLVVHVNHGIGVFRGLATAPAAGGGERECLVLEYAPNQPGEAGPRLYVPVREAHLVSKYVGAGKLRPPLNTLGGGRWARAREQAMSAIRDLAADLLRVQAERASLPGAALKPDTEWQRELEASFEFEETPDQLRAIEAVKRDLEAARPMDRLLCGDVGFGKTEVALRAAFKAVMSGKQVAVLAPTTVLAQQHFNLFRERMAGYPVRVELLSRFRRPSERRAALAAAASGEADIIIGTHGLAQLGVVFHDLGLLVIDEEQRFGVRHKEALRRLRGTVDTLTLSATPIPRTLYMALAGARDLSTLETPPLDRLPVETTIGDYDDRTVRDAILRELNRSGQVYYVHNRVATIDAVAARLRALVPDARVAIGHGQMADDELEEVMTRFVAGEADVLVSTTIIESGLDIPNANTMIIERADRFGLGELYQLRGRVGRYKHQAYCLLLLPRHARLLTDARRRLSAIKRYAALGSGFKIALRDLEIRGAGNILGAEQSGHITAVGFDLYCRLLQQSIRTLQGEKPAVRADTRVSLDFLALDPGEERRVAPRLSPHAETGKDEEPAPAEVRERAPAYLPFDYAPEPAQRLELYRRLAQSEHPGQLAALRAELRDRFGAEPRGVARLFAVHELRFQAAERGVSAVEVTGDVVRLTRGGDLLTVGGRLPRLQRKEADARLAELRRLLGALR